MNDFNLTNKSSDSQKDNFPPKTANQFEYDEKFGTLNDTNSIQIELADLSWNITDVHLNFTNINQHSQLRTIEGNSSTSSLKQIYYYSPKPWSVEFINLYGQELNFSETTQVLGVYLYGYVSGPPDEVRFACRAAASGSRSLPRPVG